MKRDSAREIAIQIVYGAAITGSAFTDFSEHFLADEHYSSLAEEEELAELYDKGFDKQTDYLNSVISAVNDNLSEIDARIEKHAHGWSLSRISGTALAVLRVCTAEILYLDDVPDSAAINSAVEISKGYDDEQTVSFINGVLGSIVRERDSAE